MTTQPPTVGQLPGLREVAEGQPFGGEGGLDLGAGGAGAEGGQPGVSVEGREPGQPFEVEDQRRALRGQLVDPSGHRGAAAPGDHPDPLPRAGGEGGLDLVGARRSGHAVRQGGDPAGAQANQVRQGLAAGVGQPVEGIDRDRE